MTSVDLLLDGRAALGECPVWCPDEQSLYWVDVAAPSLNMFDPSTGIDRSYPMPEAIGSFALRRAGGFLVALKSGLAFFDAASGRLDRLGDPEPRFPHNRLNDGRCDRDGRFWVGSMHDAASGEHPTGGLYRFEADGRITRHLEGLRTSNGLAFSPDGATMYFSDSHPSVRTIWAFDYDRATGTPRNQRVFVDTDGMAGRPDGAAVDSDGCYWSAAADGWEVVRWTPDARIDRRVRMPVSKPSMLAFGGPDLRTAFVTSLRRPCRDLEREPHAGGIFAFDAGVAGLPEPKFAH